MFNIKKTLQDNIRNVTVQKDCYFPLKGIVSRYLIKIKFKRGQIKFIIQSKFEIREWSGAKMLEFLWLSLRAEMFVAMAGNEVIFPPDYFYRMDETMLMLMKSPNYYRLKIFLLYLSNMYKIP